MRKVTTSITINTIPEQVIRAFTDPDMLKGWWGVERSFVEPQPGGAYTLLWGVSAEGIKYISSGVISEYNAAGKLVVSNMVYINPEKPVLGLMSITVTAVSGSNGTEAIITQDGYRDGETWDWYYEAVKEAWPQVAVTLKNYIESLN